MKLTTADFMAAAAAVREQVLRRDRAETARADITGAEKASKPCAFWADGLHCLVAGFVGGSGAFYEDRPTHTHNAKQCRCGARIRPKDFAP